MRIAISTLLALVLCAAVSLAPAGAQPGYGRGVTLYEHANFSGRSQTFTDDVPRLQETAFGQDAASSVRVSPGCRVTLYRDSDYHGPLTVLTHDFSVLEGTEVGNDSVSSMRVECGRESAYEGSREGVTLFEDAGFRGDSETFGDDDADLGNNRIRPDRASSVRVPRGCRATLYEHPGFSGRAVTLEQDASDLGHTPVGNDKVSSIEVDCLGENLFGEGLGFVVLYEQPDFGGRRERFRENDSDLRDNRVGKLKVSSLRLADGCRVTLYEDTGYRGRSITFDNDVADLERSPLRRRQAESLRVDCGRSGGDGHDGDGWEGRRGAILYGDADFRGTSELLTDDEPRLGNRRIGNDKASSIRVAEGCEAILFEDDNFRGRSVTLREDVADLGRAGFNDRASSIQVRCAGWRR